MGVGKTEVFANLLFNGQCGDSLIEGKNQERRGEPNRPFYEGEGERGRSAKSGLSKGGIRRVSLGVVRNFHVGLGRWVYEEENLGDSFSKRRRGKKGRGYGWEDGGGV